MNNLNEHLNIKDNVDVHYCPDGIISIYDSTGKLVSRTHNTIVKSGRQIIADIFAKKMPLTESDLSSATVPASSYTISLGLGYTADQALITASTEAIPTGKLIPLTSGNLYYSHKDLQYTISYDVTLKTINSIGNTSLVSYCINTIFTQFNDGTNNILFSEAYIDPVFIDATTVYTISYSFYF